MAILLSFFTILFFINVFAQPSIIEKDLNSPEPIAPNISVYTIITVVVFFIAAILKVVNAQYGLFSRKEKDNGMKQQDKNKELSTSSLRDIEEEQEEFKDEIRHELKEMFKAINDLNVRMSVVEAGLKRRTR